MRDRYGRGYGDRGEMRGQDQGMWQGRGGFGMRGGRGYGFGCEQDGSGVVLEALNIRALHPAYLAHLAQQNSVFVCVQQQDGLGVKGPRMVADNHRGLGRGFGIAQGYGRAGHKGQGCGCEDHEAHGHGCEGHEGRGHGCEGHEGHGWGHGRLGRDGQGCGCEGHEGRGHGRADREGRGRGRVGRAGLEGRGRGRGLVNQVSSQNPYLLISGVNYDSSKPLQILSVKIPRTELAPASTTSTATEAAKATKSSTPARSKERHTVADVVAAGLCTGCGDCVALCAKRQAISMQTNDAGDLVPVVDMELCNLCGKCYRKCPSILEAQSSQH